MSGFALRDQSTECLCKIIERVARDTGDNFSSELFRVVIVRHLLNEVKANLRLKSEVSFSICLVTLGAAVTEVKFW